MSTLQIPTQPQWRADAEQRAQSIALVAFDVDGTLTDGRLFYGDQGEVAKGFSVRDGFGIELLRRAGIRTAIVTGRQSDIVARRAAELRFDRVLQKVDDKRRALLDLCSEFALQPSQAAFMGDDWPDLPALRAAGLAATVVDAPAPVKLAAHWIGSAAPGMGAGREFCEWLLGRQGRLAALLTQFQD